MKRVALGCIAALFAASVSAADETANKNTKTRAANTGQSVQIGTVDGRAQLTINQTINQIREDDPKLAEAVLRLTEQLGAKDTESRSLRDDNSKLQQQLDIAQAALRLAQDARAPNAEPDVRAAREAFLRGDTQAAETLLRKREQALATEGRQHLAEAAKLARERGALADGRDTAAAVEAYRQATEYEPINVVNWIQLGDLLVTHGQLADATRAYKRLLDLTAEKAARDPANTQWQRDLSVSHGRIGDVLIAQGDLPAALAEYCTALKIAEPLAARDPANTQWQRDLSVARGRIGDVLIAQGDLSAALGAFRSALKIAEPPAARDPADTAWQRDLSVSHERIGEVLIAQGDLPAALGAFRTALKIAEPLAARDPTNREWQRDVVISLLHVGQFASATEALPLLERASGILDRLSSERRPLADQRELSGEVARLMDRRRSELAIVEAQ